MQIGHDIDTSYNMSIKGRCWILDKITGEKDLGVHTTFNLRPSRHCIKSAQKAMSVPEIIKRSFWKVDNADFMLLYKTCKTAASILQAWSPHLKKDIQSLKKDQRRATRMVIGMSDVPYKVRLKKTGIDLT